MISLRRVAPRWSLGVVALGTLLVVAPRASAQLTAANARWQAWVGCWQQDDPTQSPLAPGAPLVCVVPTATASAVDVVTVDSGKVVSRYTVDASGREHPVNRDGCTGWERARWSNDSLRVFLSSELTCGAMKRTSTGVMSISPSGEWVSVDAVKAGANEAVRATHYRDVEAPAQLPTDIALAATLGRRLDRRTAAIAAGARLTGTVIVEATHALDTAAVQAWLVERHETYNLSAAMLVALADAGVPGSVTDVMVAATYPEEFHFSRGPAPSMMGLSPTDSARIAADYLLGRGRCDPLSYYSPYGWGVNPCNSYYGGYQFGAYPGYRYGYGYGYGYSPFGYGYGYGYQPGYYSGIYTGPVVIVSNNADTHGRAVKGQGYTRSSGSSSSGGGGSSAGSSSSSSGSSGSSGSSSSGSASSSGSSGRTAHPRPPAE